MAGEHHSDRGLSDDELVQHVEKMLEDWHPGQVVVAERPLASDGQFFLPGTKGSIVLVDGSIVRIRINGSLYDMHRSALRLDEG